MLLKSKTRISLNALWTNDNAKNSLKVKNEIKTWSSNSENKNHEKTPKEDLIFTNQKKSKLK